MKLTPRDMDIPVDGRLRERIEKVLDDVGWLARPQDLEDLLLLMLDRIEKLSATTPRQGQGG